MLIFIAALFIVQACFAGTIPATPENITITFLTPTSVRVSWQTMLDIQTHPVDKYVVTYKPTDDRVVKQVAGNSEAVILDRLSPSTQYSIGVTAIWLGKKYRSRQIVFRTLDSPKILPHQDSGMPPGHQMGIYHDDMITVGSNLTNSTVRELPPIRGVEIGIVLIVLMVWAGAIALFFNRWGKIRMLLPYQPDYKHEQLKVPGSNACSGGACSGQHSHQFEGSDTGTIVSPSKPKLSHFHYLQEEPSVTIAERCTRSRINSAIFVSSEGRGFDSIEFLRRYGSQSVLCRKARSAENISNENRTNEDPNSSCQLNEIDDIERNFSNKRQWHTEDGATTRTKNQSIQGESIELAECHSMPIPQNQKIQLQNENFTSTATTTTTLNNNIIPITTIQPPTIITPGSHTATVTTANAVVGSISIETPPPHLRQQQKQQQYKDSQESKKSKSIDVDSETTIIIPPREAPVLTKQTKKLIHQKSTSSTPNTSYSRSPSGSPNHSPILINLKNHNTPKINTQLPTLSVSEPSPPHDTQEFL
ncbi:uncharacterized protein LOC129605778 isoform X4 [Condylostylus longicornis]|uniref:uncharacterized protein LOC129605778 isoform X4 n=1 Tax=Condylostylus longicornis TaxID=2530218 RepID=UPI00244DE08F|nr:uncharacterized protein LOC129605778 isoform X4 [Condylostylus longicornis]